MGNNVKLCQHKREMIGFLSSPWQQQQQRGGDGDGGWFLFSACCLSVFVNADKKKHGRLNSDDSDKLQHVSPFLSSEVTKLSHLPAHALTHRPLTT